MSSEQRTWLRHYSLKLMSIIIFLVFNVEYNKYNNEEIALSWSHF